jgi:16S rRNA (cytosine1402-N4)-methyltransferase
MEVNDELESLVDALDQTIDRLVLGGRVAVLAYHSGEDRRQDRFRRADRGVQLPVRPAPACAAPPLRAA